MRTPMGREKSRPSGEGAAVNRRGCERRRPLGNRRAQKRGNEAVNARAKVGEVGQALMRINEVERGCEHRRRREENILTRTNESTTLALAKGTVGIESASGAERAAAAQPEALGMTRPGTGVTWHRERWQSSATRNKGLPPAAEDIVEWKRPARPTWKTCGL